MGDLNHAENQPEKFVNPKVSAIFVLLLAVFVYMFFALDTAEADTVTVQVSANGITTLQPTSARTVGELVNLLYPADEVVGYQPGATAEIAPMMQITVQLKPTALPPAVARQLEQLKEEQKEVVVAAAPTPSPPPAKKVEPKSPTYSGTATWYRFGSGLTTASTQFPKGTKLRVTADASGKFVDVVVNDYGPTAETGVNLDLNKPAFQKLAPLGAGRINVHYYVIE